MSLCEFVHASMENSILNLQYLLFASYIWIRKCVLKVRGKINNVVILVTQI